jgi:hypothetical protein
VKFVPVIRSAERVPRFLHGCIDVATRTLIEGWVWDPECPEERIELELLEDGRQLATFIADRSRPPLADVGIGDGCHAFRFEIPLGRLSGQDHVLNLRCAITGAIVPGSPIIIDQSCSSLPASLRWHIDEITPDGIVGWVMDMNEPLRRCMVTLMEGSSIHSRATASRYRAGLREAGIGDGYCEFNLRMPRCLLDGDEHLISIIEEVSGETLTPEPHAWRFAAVFSEFADKPCTTWSAIALHELLHGRNPETSFVIESAKSKSIRSLFTSIVKSDEFRAQVLLPFQEGRRLRHELTSPSPTPYQCSWIASLLSLAPCEEQNVRQATSWVELFASMFSSIEATLHGRPRQEIQNEKLPI